MNRRHILSIALVLLFTSLGSAVGQLKKIPQDVIDKIAAALPEKAPAQPKKPRKVLLFSKTNGFRHGSISVGVKSLTMLGEKTGAFTAEHSEDEAVFAPKNLQKYDLVIMVNTTGEIFRPRQWPKDAAEKKAAQEKEIVSKPISIGTASRSTASRRRQNH